MEWWRWSGVAFEGGVYGVELRFEGGVVETEWSCVLRVEWWRWSGVECGGGGYGVEVRLEGGVVETGMW